MSTITGQFSSRGWFVPQVSAISTIKQISDFVTLVDQKLGTTYKFYILCIVMHLLTENIPTNLPITEKNKRLENHILGIQSHNNYSLKEQLTKYAGVNN